jgi:hypothetical protein
MPSARVIGFCPTETGWGEFIDQRQPWPGAPFPLETIVLYFGIAASQLKDYSFDIA